MSTTWKDEIRRIAGQMTQVPQIQKNEVPGIHLYMDQLITYLEHRLSFFQRDTDTPLITATMVNNYSKAGLTRPARSKRYDRAHVMALSVICQLKRMFSIHDMARVAAPLETPEQMAPAYEAFLDAQQEAYNQLPGYVEALISKTEARGIDEEHQDQALAALVMQLAVGAQRDILLAERLIDAMGQEPVPRAVPKEPKLKKNA